MGVNPSLLLHPNIPKPLHGLAPRKILGDDWWEKQRQLAYAHNDYHCWACGVHKRDAKYHKWLEAHEIYDVNYTIGRVKFEGVCALCHSCHNFIHSGRLSVLYQRGEIEKIKIMDILVHGFEVLKTARLNMNPFALRVMKEINEPTFKKYLKYGFHEYGQCFAEWEDWHLVVNGKTYYSEFKSIKDWQKHYKYT